MSAGPGVFCSVPIWRGVAAQRDAARLTGSQMHPSGANFHALFTLTPLWVFDGRNSRYVIASFVSHLNSPSGYASYARSNLLRQTARRP